MGSIVTQELLLHLDEENTCGQRSGKVFSIFHTLLPTFFKFSNRCGISSM